MPSTSTSPNVADWMTSQRNVTILVAILVAVPVAYGFQMVVSGANLGGSFLLLMTLAVGVPTAYDEYWPKYDRTWNTIVWVVVACVVVTVEFTGLYLIGTGPGNLSPLFASVGAFLITELGNLAWLSVRKRQRDSSE